MNTIRKKWSIYLTTLISILYLLPGCSQFRTGYFEFDDSVRDTLISKTKLWLNDTVALKQELYSNPSTSYYKLENYDTLSQIAIRNALSRDLILLQEFKKYPVELDICRIIESLYVREKKYQTRRTGRISYKNGDGKELVFYFTQPFNKEEWMLTEFWFSNYGPVLPDDDEK